MKRILLFTLFLATSLLLMGSGPYFIGTHPGVPDAPVRIGGLSDMTYTPPVDATPPAVPTQLNAAPCGATVMCLTWDSNTDDDIAFYKVYRDVYGGSGLVWVSQWYHQPGPEQSYTNAGLEPSTRYLFEITAVDWDGNESAHSNQVDETTDPLPADKPVYFTKSLTAQVDSADVFISRRGDPDSLNVEVRVSVNTDCWTKLISWAGYEGITSDYNSNPLYHVPADTGSTFFADWDFARHPVTANRYSWQDWVNYQTPIPAPVWDADSTITITWDWDDSGLPLPTSVWLWREHNRSGNWEVVSNTLTGDSTTFYHSLDNAHALVPPRRGVERYKLRGYRGPDQSPETYDIDEPYYNQAVEIFYEVHASDGTATVRTNSVSDIYIAQDIPDPDVTEPALDLSKAHMFGATTDTTNIADVKVVASIITNEPTISRIQVAYNGGGLTWVTPNSGDDWESTVGDSTFKFVQLYEWQTGLSTDALLSMSSPWDFKDNAATQNVNDSGGLTLVDFQGGRKDPDAVSGVFILSNYTSALDSTLYEPTGHWVHVDNFMATMDRRTSDRTNATVVWGNDNSTEYDPAYALPMSSYHISLPQYAPGCLSFSSGGGTSRSNPFFRFGDGTLFAGKTVVSAVLHVASANRPLNQTYSNIDTLKVYNCTGSDVLDEWVTAGAGIAHDISYVNSAQSTTTAWSVDPETSWNDNRDWFGLYADFAAENLPGPGTFTNLDVTELVQAQIDAGKPLLFYFTFRSLSSTNPGQVYVNFYDNGTQGSEQEKMYRPYLEIEVE